MEIKLKMTEEVNSMDNIISTLERKESNSIFNTKQSKNYYQVFTT